MLTVGHDGEHVPDDPDVATWPSRAFDALQQRDEARAQLADRDRVIAAVRELAENARRHAGGPYTASVDALSIERALDQEATR